MANKKILSAVILLFTAVINAFCETSVSRWKGQMPETLNVGKDSIFVGKAGYPNTITIGLGDNLGYVDVEIYQQGVLITTDREMVGNGTTINYTITDDTHGFYDVYIRKDGKLIWAETVSLEE